MISCMCSSKQRQSTNKQCLSQSQIRYDLLFLIRPTLTCFAEFDFSLNAQSLRYRTCDVHDV